jgi:hypothetical protein
MLEKYMVGMISWFSGVLGLVSTGSKMIKDPPAK